MSREVTPFLLSVGSAQRHREHFWPLAVVPQFIATAASVASLKNPGRIRKESRIRDRRMVLGNGGDTGW